MRLKHQHTRQPSHPIDISKSFHFCRGVPAPANAARSQAWLRIIDGRNLSAKENMGLSMPSPLTLRLLVPSSYFTASVFRGPSREARGTKGRLKRLLFQQPRTSISFRTYLCRVEVSDGNAVAV